MESIEDVIRLREEAIQKLLEEKARLETELETLTTRLGGISEQLRRLGYREAGKAGKPRPVSPSGPGEHTIEQHLDRKRASIVDLFRRLSKEIRSFGEDVQVVPRKYYIAYLTSRNFCEVLVQASKLRVHVDVAHSELHDPQDIAEDCSTVGTWATGDTRFDVRSLDEVDYALSLIQQAYQRSR
jgi:predicted transport protein